MLFTTLGQAVYLLWWLSLTKDMQTEQLLCWSGMTDTEHSKINKQGCGLARRDMETKLRDDNANTKIVVRILRCVRTPQNYFKNAVVPTLHRKYP